MSIFVDCLDYIFIFFYRSPLHWVYVGHWVLPWDLVPRDILVLLDLLSLALLLMLRYLVVNDTKRDTACTIHGKLLYEMYTVRKSHSLTR
jgi:hypothetical protein